MVERLIAYLTEHAGVIALRVAAAAGILFLSFVASRIAARGARRLVSHGRGGRGASLAPLVAALVKVLVLGVGVATALDQVGVNVAALLAGAGVVGLAIGFGAQTLVKDCLSGFFLIIDDVLAVGDIVTIDDTGGQVEKVGIRMTQVRSFEGQLWYVPNGEIKRVGNWNRGWVRAIVTVGLAYEQDVDRGLAVLRKVGAEWAAKNAKLVLEPPEVQGILAFNGSDVSVRLVIKMDNATFGLWEAERTLRCAVKAAFDAEGVEIPFGRQVVYHRQEGATRLRLEGAAAG